MNPSALIPRYVPSASPLLVAIQGLALTILFTSGLVDLARAVPMGPVTSQAVLTALYFCGSAFLLALVPGRSHPVTPRSLPLLAFWLWAATSLAWTPAFSNGVQNVLVIGTMLVTFLLAEAIGTSEPSFAFWLERQVFRSSLLAVAVYGVSVVWFGVGTNEVFSARNFGLFALFGVAHGLSRWRYGSYLGLLYAIAITLLIGVSESRLALGIAVVLFPLAQIPTHRLLQAVRMLTVFCVVAACSYAGFFYSEALQQRFLSGDVSIRIGSIAINGSGRAAFWRFTMQSIQDSPILGKGAGAAGALIDSVFPGLAHPHNDYLRIVHDYGALGAGIWAVAILVLLAALWQRWRWFDVRDRVKARLHLTAILSLIAFTLEMTAENALVYLYVTAPLGLIVGSALGIPMAKRGHRIDGYGS
jgi:O-antigen ligase